MSARSNFAFLAAVMTLSFASIASAQTEPNQPAAAGGPAADDATAPPSFTKKDREKIDWLHGFKVSGYVQPQFVTQYFNDAASPNLQANGTLPPDISANQVTAKADGTTTNQTYFKIRRARLKTEYSPSDWARFVFEIDPFLGGGTSGEAGTIARNVEAIGIAKWSDDAVTEFGMGIFKIPFGYEVLQSDADRPFIERSWKEQNLTPGEFEYGARAYTSLLKKKLQIQLAVTNGQMQGEKNFTKLPDLNAGKDFIGRANYDFGIVDFGVSGLYGKGENVDPAGRTKPFPRWGVNFEGALHHTFAPNLGPSKLFLEYTLAQNLDRGTKYGFALPAIPTPVSSDVTNQKEMGFFVRAEQDLGEWVRIALRYDWYTPDTSLDTNGRSTYGGVFVVKFTKGLELRSEYAFIKDDVHKNDGKSQPAGKKIHFMSYVLQARF